MNIQGSLVFTCFCQINTFFRCIFGFCRRNSFWPSILLATTILGGPPYLRTGFDGVLLQQTSVALRLQTDAPHDTHSIQAFNEKFASNKNKGRIQNKQFLAINPLQPKVFGVKSAEEKLKGYFPIKHEILSFEKCPNYRISDF